MPKKKTAQMKMKFDKRGYNSVEASKLYRKSKRQWDVLFNSEVKKEKQRKKPNMPAAAKRASTRYKKVSLTWTEAQRKAGKCKTKKSRK